MKTRTYLSLFITGFIILGLGFGYTKPAHAVLPVTDVGNTAPNASSAISNLGTFLKEFAIDTVTTNIGQRLLNKVVDSTVNWAAGGFDGKPAFLEGTVQDLVKGVAYDAYTNTLDYAGSVANLQFSNAQDEALTTIKDSCVQEVKNKNLPADSDALAELMAECDQLTLDEGNDFSLGGKISGALAEANYKSFISGNLTGSRDAVTAVTNFAAKQLTGTDAKLDHLLAGGGDALKDQLGSRINVDKFLEGDLASGGWNAYSVANSGIERKININNTLQEKANAKIVEKVDSLKINQTFFNKTKCEEWKYDAEGNKTDDCLRETITTPGTQISAKISNSLNKEEDQLKLAKELSDIMAQAVGRLTDGLIQVGLNKIGGAIKNKAASVIADEDARFRDVFQNDYDVLGIGSGGTTEEEDTPSGAGDTFALPGGPIGFDPNSDKLSNDGSIPPIEDLQRITSLEHDLESGYIQTETYILGKQEIVNTMQQAMIPLRELDRCVPGPDYNWEDRYMDLIDTTGVGYGGKFENAEEDGEDGEDEDNKEEKYTSPKITARANKLGLNLTKQMVNDRQLNIPGAIEMLALVNAYAKSASIQMSNVRALIGEKRSTSFTLSQMLSFVKIEFEDIIEAKSETIDALSLDEDKYTTAERNTFLKIPIVSTEWQALSTTEKTAILSLEIPKLPSVEIGNQQEDNNLTDLFRANTYLFEVHGSSDVSMVLNAQNGLTPAEFLQKNPEKAEKIVLGYAWKIWKEGMLLKPENLITGDPSGETQMNNALRFLYSIRNSVATDQDLLDNGIELDTVIANNIRAVDYMQDCITLRNFVYDTDSELVEMYYSSGGDGADEDGKDFYDEKQGTVHMLNITASKQYDWVVNTEKRLGEELKKIFLFGVLGGVQQALNMKDFRSNLNDLKNAVKNRRKLFEDDSDDWVPTHEEIITFLEEEREKQIDGDDSTQSLFVSDIITSPTRIDQSILGKSTSEMREYYTRVYGPKPNRSIDNYPLLFGNVPAVDIYKLYERDYMVSNFTLNNRKVKGRTGALFCWTEGDYSMNKRGKSNEGAKVVSECLKPWYYAKDLEYRVLFSELN